jgi:hypothetical protein
MERVAYIVIHSGHVEYNITDHLDNGKVFRIGCGSDPFGCNSIGENPVGREEVVGAMIFDLLEGWAVDSFTIIRNRRNSSGMIREVAESGAYTRG